VVGFVFDPAGVETVLKDLRQLHQDLLTDVDMARPLVEVTGPGREPASWRMANAAVLSGEAFQTHNVQLRTFVQQYITALVAARDEYLRRDEDARDQFERS